MFILVRQLSSRILKIKKCWITGCVHVHAVYCQAMNEKDKNQTVREGKAEILQPSSVFYNPVQEFNRDLTINVISEFVKDHFKDVQENATNTARNKKKLVAKVENAAGDSKDITSKESVENSCHGTTDLTKLGAGTKCENGITILEGLAASGLRSIRFGLEVPGVKKIVVNDFDKNAVEIIKRNISKNGLDSILEASYGDAAMVMYQNRADDDRFNVIDLDPYGSPSKFLDSAVQAVSEGGLLCITATDMALLCGNTPEACFAKYGAIGLKMKSCHEMALRIVLQSIESHANRYSRYIVPLISISADFYIRVFLRVYTGAAKTKESATKMAMVHFCTGCTSFTLQRIAQKIATKGDNFKVIPGSSPVIPDKCEHCGHRHIMGGPIWADPVHDKEFLKRVIDRVKQRSHEFTTAARIEGMLSMAMEEESDCPLYYTTDDLCQVLHCCPISLEQLRSGLLNAGFRVSCSHATKNAIKTNATNQDIWDILREWVKKNPVHEKRMMPGSVTKAILEQEQTLKVSFERHPQANPETRRKGLVRWQENPTKYWGPGSRAKRSGTDDSHFNKAKRLQNKKKKRVAEDQKDETGTSIGSEENEITEYSHNNLGL